MIKTALVLSLLATSAFATEQTICGRDERVLSSTPEIGRIMKPTEAAGCTVTMISRSCAVSAGHCTSTFSQAQFNTPPSRGGRVVFPAESDIYQVDKDSIVYTNGGVGNDYAVLRLKPNKHTGMLAGDAQGFFEVGLNIVPRKGDMISITGYGRDDEADRNFAQQFNAGEVESVSGTTLRHRADTMGGNSGSSVIDVESGKIIGIHTHGGCSSRGGANSSTLLAKHTQFKAAIKACLDWERDNL